MSVLYFNIQRRLRRVDGLPTRSHYLSSDGRSRRFASLMSCWRSKCETVNNGWEAARIDEVVCYSACRPRTKMKEKIHLGSRRRKLCYLFLNQKRLLCAEQVSKYGLLKTDIKNGFCDWQLGMELGHRNKEWAAQSWRLFWFCLLLTLALPTI